MHMSPILTPPHTQALAPRAGHARHQELHESGRSFILEVKTQSPRRLTRTVGQLCMGRHSATVGWTVGNPWRKEKYRLTNFCGTSRDTPEQNTMMIKPYMRQGEGEEVVSPLQWMDGDMSSPDGDTSASSHHYRVGGTNQQDREMGSEDAEEDEEDEEEGQEDENESKRRGPKKKRITKARQERFRARRIKANARERSRMHGLNDALENLRSIMPCHSKTQKLSKIETLRLARNYICALSEALEGGLSTESRAFMETLCKGLSQPTTNLVAGCLQLGPAPGAGMRTEDRHSVQAPTTPLGGVVSYSSPGLPSPPYGTFDSAHLLHLRAMKGGVHENHSPNEYNAGGVGTPPYDGPPTPPLSISSNLVSKQDPSPHYPPPHHYSPSPLGHALYQAQTNYDVHLEGPYDPYHPLHMTSRQTASIYRD